MPSEIYRRAMTQILRRIDERFSDPGNDHGVRGYGYCSADHPERVGIVMLQENRDDLPDLPSQLTATVDGETIAVPVRTARISREDAAGGHSAPEGIPPGPGVPVAGRRGKRWGTIGFGVSRNDSGQPRFAVTAWHLVAGGNPGATLYQDEAILGKLASDQLQPFHDGALIALHPDAVNAWTDRVPTGDLTVGPVKNVEYRDLDSPARLYSATRDRLISTRVLGIGMTITLLPNPFGGFFLQRNMIATPRATDPGDSGTALVVPGGTLGIASVRMRGLSFFSSAKKILDGLREQLDQEG